MDNVQLDALMKSLTSQIESAVNDSLIKDVQPKVIKLLESHAINDFYSQYKPRRYYRQYSLLKDSTYKTDFIKNGFKISSDYYYDNVVDGAKHYIFDIAEDGQDKNLWWNNGVAPWSRSSHFLTNTYKELNGGLACEWLKEGLRKRGLTVK